MKTFDNFKSVFFPLETILTFAKKRKEFLIKIRIFCAEKFSQAKQKFNHELDHKEF